MNLILNTQPRLKFLEFLLVAPWSDQWITNLILIFPADFGNKIQNVHYFVFILVDTYIRMVSRIYHRSPLAIKTQ